MKNCALIGFQNIKVYVQLLQEFEKGIAAQGVAIGAHEMVQNIDTDFSSISTKIVFSDVDCGFIASMRRRARGSSRNCGRRGWIPRSR
ncbi:hypothetical protein [Paracoccus thiocyanatus]|uniref:Uncharacterized protein n=1 Tax=Paracoccus thiocyanatus TaxID=34006 RepID=A0A3D8P9P1_9RHOB|nr:hypothetical protein [Paracoccus thiocyanatus]RDW12048.1 hypothetical protein DIE28_15795 [Paracoccus thiocyanatus]